MSDDELDRLVRRFQRGQFGRLKGTASPQDLSFLGVHGGNELWIPSWIQPQPGPMDFAHSYIDSSHYMFMRPEEIIARCLQCASRMALLDALVVLNKATHKPELATFLEKEFTHGLPPLVRTRFESAMQPKGGGERPFFLSRQMTLNAMRVVLAADEPAKPDPNANPLSLTILLTHAVSATFSASATSTGQRVVGWPIELAMELVQNQLFNKADDYVAAIDRQVRLWTEFDQSEDPNPFGISPTELLRQATGLDFYDLLAFGFGLYTLAVSWKPGGARAIPWQFNSTSPPGQIEQFLDLLSTKLDQFGSKVGNLSVPWDLLAFERTPVLEYDDHLWVLDERLLFDRVLSGLYWFVADFLKLTKGDNEFFRWGHLYGRMLEQLVRSQLAALAPKLLTADQQTVFFSEKDLQQRFGGSQCDAAVHFGPTIVLFEVVSRGLTVLSRSQGSFSKFLEDTDKIVMEEVPQLESTSRRFLGASPSEFGFTASVTPRILPVLITGENYPWMPFTAKLVASLIHDKGWLAHHQIHPLAIIDITELEMLEALAEQGHTWVEIICQWALSTLHDMPLRNYIVDHYQRDNGALLPPSRMKLRFEQVSEIFRDRLHLESDGSQEEREPDTS